MTKMKKKRKGFTLTELAIVIAVIAILIAVLVPTFVSLINKANESADEQAVKSMNTSLATAEAIDGKPDNAIEAMAVLEADGFNVENYVALDSGNTIYYDLTYNRCLIWTTASDGTGSVTYPSDLASTYASATGVAANWYTFASIYKQTTADIVTVDSNTDIETAISTAQSAGSGEAVIIELAENIGAVTYDETTMSYSNSANVTIDLNGNTLELDTTGISTISSGSTLYIKDGTVDVSCKTTVYKVNAGSSITLENVEIESEGSTLICPLGTAAQVNIIDATINISASGYAVSTNSATDSNYNVAINIENSTIEMAHADSCAVMINVAGTLNISDSTIIGHRQGVIVRAGTATITNTTISCSMNMSNDSSDITNTANEYMIDRTTYSRTWGSGNRVSLGAVVVGNDTEGTGSDYKADAILTMSGCAVSYEITGTNASSYSNYEIGLFLMRKATTAYKTEVTLTNNTTIDGYVVKMTDGTGYTADLTGYTGTIYTKWSDGWTTD